MSEAELESLKNRGIEKKVYPIYFEKKKVGGNFFASCQNEVNFFSFIKHLRKLELRQYGVV